MRSLFRRLIEKLRAFVRSLRSLGYSPLRGRNSRSGAGAGIAPPGAPQSVAPLPGTSGSPPTHPLSEQEAVGRWPDIPKLTGAKPEFSEQDTTVSAEVAKHTKVTGAIELTEKESRSQREVDSVAPAMPPSSRSADLISAKDQAHETAPASDGLCAADASPGSLAKPASEVPLSSSDAIAAPQIRHNQIPLTHPDAESGPSVRGSEQPVVRSVDPPGEAAPHEVPSPLVTRLESPPFQRMPSGEEVNLPAGACTPLEATSSSQESMNEHEQATAEGSQPVTRANLSPSVLQDDELRLRREPGPHAHSNTSPAVGPSRTRPSEERQRHRAAPAPYDQPFTGPGVRAPGEDYLSWNRAIAHHCLFADASADETVYLAITPRVLAGAFAEACNEQLTPEDAETRFAEAVSAMYQACVLSHPRRLQVLRRCGPDGLPECAAFLALSVLAAYRMQTDEEAAATAYYRRLDELLRCGLAAGGLPRGFELSEFEGLWVFLHAWLDREHGRRLAMPGADVGLRRYVALPLSHVPLRTVDIERLPDFFSWAAYEPGEKVARSELEARLRAWCAGRSAFTTAGMAALADERRPAVVAQVAHELEAWDGSHADAPGRRRARVEILLDVIQRRPVLSFLPRRPAVFPAVFDDGVHSFEATDEGWYSPLPILREDGTALAEGFAWEVVAHDLRFTLHRPASSAIALPNDGYTGFRSHPALRLGIPAAVLCREELAAYASDYLSSISNGRCYSMQSSELPCGWQAFLGVVPRSIQSPPAGLEALAVDAERNLIPTGGLRLGSRWAWLAGAPPRIALSGYSVGAGVAVNGSPISVAEDGTLAADQHLARPGIHLIEAPGVQRRIEIVEPRVNAPRPEPRVPSFALALPPGFWTLLGETPGQVAAPASQAAGGALALCLFKPIWAVELGTGRGARVLCLVAHPPPPQRVSRGTRSRRSSRRLLTWADQIYGAAMRRPEIRGLSVGDGAELAASWGQYRQAARLLKRQLKSHR